MKKFKKTYIEITNVCNLDCPFCPKTKRKAAFMDEAVFKTVLEKIKGSASFLYFHVMGEPLMHPKLGRFLDLAAGYGYRVNLTTNGTLVEKLYGVMDKPALRQVNFSLHANRDDAGYLGAILDFTDEAREKGKLIALRLWNHGSGSGGNTAAIEKIKARFCPGRELQDKPTHVRGIKVAENVFLNQAEEFAWPSLRNPVIGKKGFCNGLRDQIAVLADGTVVPCCLDAEGVINLGNILEKDLKSIYKSERGKAFYNGFAHMNVIEDLCRKCTYRKRFDRRAKKAQL